VRLIPIRTYFNQSVVDEEYNMLDEFVLTPSLAMSGPTMEKPGAVSLAFVILDVV
jgi:hypothetical protein